MSYEKFCKSPIGTRKELVIGIGLLRFVKSSTNQWVIEFAMKNAEPFHFTRFSVVCTQIEASCLYDSYSL